MDKSVKQQVKDLLTAESRKPPKVFYCSQCGAVMQNATAMFTFGDGESWTLPLPACVKCNREDLKGWKSQAGAA